MRLSWVAALICFALPIRRKIFTATASAQPSFGDDISHDVAVEVSAQAWPSIPEAGVQFCGESHEEQTCLEYVQSLNTMLDTVGKIIEKSPTHFVVGPVSPVAFLGAAFEKIGANVPLVNIRDPELLSYYTETIARDKKAIETAMERASTSATQRDMASLKQLADRLAFLRRDLVLFVDESYEASYLGDYMPLRRLGPIARGCGSLFQRALFNWEIGRAHALDFYNNLLTSERRYVETFFERYGYEHYNFHFGLWYGNRMSSFTWSHRSKSENTSARFACGTTSQEEPFAAAAQAVLEERGILLDDILSSLSSVELNNKGVKNEQVSIHDNLSFYGLGWDFESRHFKLYLMVHALPDGLPTRYTAMVKEQLAAVGIKIARVKIEQHGLISLTYHNDAKSCIGDSSDALCSDADSDNSSYVGTNTLHEEKVYIYPTVETTTEFAKSVPHVTALDGKTTANVAWLLASKRGFVAQFDTIITPDSAAHWRRLLGAKGAQIIDDYEGIGMKLETVAFQDKDSWTLYFPSGSG